MPNDQGIRVRVWSGDQTECLGLGRLVGRVTVWYWVMPTPEYHLSSLTMAEDKPSTDEQKLMEALGGILRSDPGNPKIVLDSGRVVYGCQVWWSRVPEDEPAEITEHSLPF